MLSDRFGVAISLFNKVDALATNINIIRQHWVTNRDCFISVCCNDENSIDAVRKLDADIVVDGSKIPADSKTNLRCRQFDCIKRSVTSNEADVMVHWHADAFALDSSVLDSIYKQMLSDGKSVAFRGRGLEYRNNKTIYGDVDDHFIFFKKDAVTQHLFDVDPTRYLNACNVESLLSLLLKTKLDSDVLWHYDDMSENLVGTDVAPDQFYDDGVQHRAMNPFNVDPNRGFIHGQTSHIIKSKLLEYGIPDGLIV